MSDKIINIYGHSLLKSKIAGWTVGKEDKSIDIITTDGGRINIMLEKWDINRQGPEHTERRESKYEEVVNYLMRVFEIEE